MSFFGLTAFGPESLVKSTLVNSNGKFHTKLTYRIYSFL